MSEFIGTVIGVVVVLGLAIGIWSVLRHDDVTVSFKAIGRWFSGL